MNQAPSGPQRPAAEGHERHTRRLLALVMLALVPLAAAGVYAAWRDQRLEWVRTHQAALMLSRAAAQDAHDEVRETEELLSRLARDPTIASQDPAGARAMLADELQHNPTYDDLWAVRADGTVLADPRADPASPPANVADQPYFRQAMGSGNPAMQTVIGGAGGSRSAIEIISVPVKGPGGESLGTMQASLDLRNAPSVSSATLLHPGAVVVLLDSQGTVILHSANPARWLGEPADGQVTATILGRSGVTRQGTFLGQPVLLGADAVPGAPWEAVVALPLGPALQPWRLTLLRDGLLLVGAALLGVFLVGRAHQVGSRGWEQEAFLRTLLQSAPIGIAVAYGPENRLTLVNPTYCRLAQGPPGSVEGRTPRQAFPEATARAAESRIEEVYRSGRRVSAREEPLESRPGRTTYWDMDYVPLRARDGHIAGVLMLAAPVTAQVQARQQTEAQARKLQTVLGQLPEVVLVLDPEQRIMMASDSLRRYLRRDVVGMRLPELWAEYRVKLARGEGFHEWQAIEGEPIRGIEMEVPLPDGRRLHLLESAVPLYMPGEGGAPAHIAGAVVTLTDVTPQVEARAEVQEAYRFLQTVLDRLPSGVLIVRPDERVTTSNQTVASYLGRDVVGATLPELREEYGFEKANGEAFPPGQAPADRALRGEDVRGVEVKLCLPGGRHLDVLESAVGLLGSDGRTQCAVVVLTDITAQKRAQAEADSARRNLQTILDRLPDGVLIVDPSQRVVSTNGFLDQHAGHSVAGMALDDLRREFGYVDSAGRPFAPGQSPLERALQGEPVSGFEVGMRLPGGRRIDALESVAVLHDARGRVSGAVVTMTDITALKRAQAELEASRRDLRAIIDRLPEGVAVVDPGLRVTLVNDTLRRWTGRDVAGESIIDLWQQVEFVPASGEPPTEAQSPLQRALRGEVILAAQGSGRRADGRRIDLQESMAPLFNPDGTVREVAVVMTDVTSLKDLDRAKDEFISVAAHELRNPLSALKGHAQMLLRRAAKQNWAEQDRRGLQTIDNQVDRLNELIGRLLDVSRIRLGRLQLNRQPTDLVTLVRQVAEDTQVALEAYRITVEAEAPEISGNWDASALRQVLMNLVGNAVKYAPSGPITLRVWRVDGQAAASVSDRGPGIAPEKLGQLFEAFAPGAAQEQRKAGGLGLGLYISRGIVQAHGGCIWVQSEVGVGTTFTFTLPLLGSSGE